MTEEVTIDIITSLIKNEMTLKEEIKFLKEQLQAKKNQRTIGTQTNASDINMDESIEAIDSLEEFNGNAKQYYSWREDANHLMKMYPKGNQHHTTALIILRKKITGKANKTLLKYKTPLDFGAILARLDLAFSDRRSIFIIEQELKFLRQGKLSVLHFYNLVSKKLDLLINKTIIAYGKDETFTTQLNAKHRQTALSVFIKGLNPLLRVYELQTALAKALQFEGFELDHNNVHKRI